MQIHELNQRQQVNEVDLFGPNSVFNVGKQVLKNPASLWNSSALGAAEQSAAQASAAASAQKLANPGAFRRAMGNQAYQVGGSIKPQTTVAQRLQANASNPAVQQQVKNLAAQWTKVSAAKRTQPVTESVREFDPNMLSSAYKSMYDKLKASNDLEKKATNIKAGFQAWSDPLLRSTGIDMDDVRQNQETARLLDSAMNDIALVSASGATPEMEQQAVEKYLTLAIAAIQTAVQNSGQQQQAARAGAVRDAGPEAGSDEYNQQVLQTLQSMGISRSMLPGLGKAMTAAAQGNNIINDTGNPMLNAIAKLAGMTVR